MVKSVQIRIDRLGKLVTVVYSYEGIDVLPCAYGARAPQDDAVRSRGPWHNRLLCKTPESFPTIVFR